MKSKLNLLSVLFVVAAAPLLQSCDGDQGPVVPPGKAGFYVVNEGAFGNNNASLSFYDREKDQVTNDVFQTKNGRALGDQAQSMTVFEGRGYIVVQNSGKVEVIDLTDNSSIKTITDGIESPRYFIGVDGSKGYLSDWGADGLTGTVRVINLETLTVTKSIPVGNGPNRLLLHGSRVYVPNSGGFGKDNTISVIDTEGDDVTTTVTVGDNPNSLQVDHDGNVWVASAGHLVYNQDFSIDEAQSSKGSLTKLRGTDLTEMSRFTFNHVTYLTVGQLEISPVGDKLYYLFDGAVYSTAIGPVSNPGAVFIDQSYYGLSVDPFTGDIIGCLAPNFSAAGKIEVYNRDGQLRSTYTVGIAPNSVAFK